MKQQKSHGRAWETAKFDPKLDASETAGFDICNNSTCGRKATSAGQSEDSSFFSRGFARPGGPRLEACSSEGDWLGILPFKHLGIVVYLREHKHRDPKQPTDSGFLVTVKDETGLKYKASNRILSRSAFPEGGAEGGGGQPFSDVERITCSRTP